MKVLKIIGAIIGVIVVTVLILISTLSGKIHVERSIVVDASPDEVYRELTSYENFNAWSPWYERDPSAKYSYEGPAEGIGTKMSWKSEDPEVGDGAMWIVNIEPNKMVNQKMSFGGYPGTPDAFFYLEPVSDGTKVTWTYDENMEGLWKLSTLFMDMDVYLGPDYERGLEKLKDHIEAANATQEEVPVSKVSEKTEG